VRPLNQEMGGSKQSCGSGNCCLSPSSDPPPPPCLWQVYGTVMTINQGNPAVQEVLVDSWPEFKVVLTQPCREVMWHWMTDFYTNTYTVYYRDLHAYGPLLASVGAVNWGQTFCIHGNMCPKASGRAPQQLNIYVLSGPNPRIPPYNASPEALSVRLSSLDVSHVDLLNEMKYLATLIHDLPSVCLLDAAGHPVSWIASYPFGATGPGYTLPQHRRRGYMGMLNNLIAKRLHALGYPSYSYVAVENNPMQRLQERQGFQPQCAWHDSSNP
uniref:Glycine N-acyltransferase-like protein n=1 Tax=Terrapene triunguis TaxID=2587831 RepID=A0A674JX23_9SAUR